VPKSKLAPREASSSRGNGSGVIVSKSGYVLTAAHVVANSTKLTVITAQGSRSAKVIQVDEANDVAILKLEEGTYPALPVVSSRQVRLGQTVATIGFPIVNIQGFSPKVTRGEINSLNGAGDDPRKWQISAPVQPGNSGGPLLDENGNVIGSWFLGYGRNDSKRELRDQERVRARSTWTVLGRRRADPTGGISAAAL